MLIFCSTSTFSKTCNKIEKQLLKLLYISPTKFIILVLRRWAGTWDVFNSACQSFIQIETAVSHCGLRPVQGRSFSHQSHKKAVDQNVTKVVLVCQQHRKAWISKTGLCGNSQPGKTRENRVEKGHEQSLKSKNQDQSTTNVDHYKTGVASSFTKLLLTPRHEDITLLQAVSGSSLQCSKMRVIYV